MAYQSKADFNQSLVLAIERAAARAWPALDDIDVDGWTWRCSGGGSRRANSVLPLAFNGGSVASSIAEIEALYRERGLRSCVQVSSIAQPTDLDAQLANRGYVLEEPVLLLAKYLPPALAQDMPPTVEIAADPSPDWLAIYTATVDGVERRAAAPATLARVPGERGFLTAWRAGLALASALGVLSPDGIAIVECVATDVPSRRTGAAAEVMTGLETWAALNGATVAALQVVESNVAARALYTARGYTLASRYHYRWREV